MSLEFLITSLFVVIAPGTGVIYTLAVGLSRGQKASVAAAFGCTMGIIPHLLASIVGLAALLHASAVLFEVVKYVGVAYLLYLAWQLLKGESSLSLDNQEKTPTKYSSLITTGFLINILNPKLSIFFLAFLPQFMSATTLNPTFEMAYLGLVFMLLTFLVFIIYGAFAARLSSYVMKKPLVLKWFNRSLAGVFASLSLKLALTER